MSILSGHRAKEKLLGKLKLSHTHPERQLQVLSSPDVHARVVCAKLLKIFSAYGEQTASHRRGSIKNWTKINTKNANVQHNAIVKSNSKTALQA